MISLLQSLGVQQDLIAYLITGVVSFSAAAYWFLRGSASSPRGHDSNNTDSESSSTNDSESVTYGVWKPQKPAYPSITPQLIPVRDIKPISNRPFKAGTQHVTMGIRNMVWNEWIELDNQFERYYQIRKHRIQQRGEGLIRVLQDGHNPKVGGGGLAAIELVHELAAYLSTRYPTDFVVTRHERQVVEALSVPLPSRASATTRFCDWGWDGALPIKSITVEGLKVTYELPLHVADGEKAPERALEIAALLVQDDLALMIEGDDGRYYFQAGAIVVPGFWRIQDKIGLPLDEIHTSGDVPRYREKLQGSMERFFRRLEVEKPVARSNFFFQVVRSKEHPTEDDIVDPGELGWGTTSNGPEDEFAMAHSFDTGPQKAPTIEEMRLRTERQTLRRLGVSGAIVFTIRTYVVPLTELGAEKGAATRLASALRGMGEDIREYKGVYRGGWLNVVLDFLDDKGERS